VSYKIFNIHLIVTKKKKKGEVTFAVDERDSIHVPLIAMNTVSDTQVITELKMSIRALAIVSYMIDK
jgi:hypothetical protein